MWFMPVILTRQTQHRRLPFHPRHWARLLPHRRYRLMIGLVVLTNWLLSELARQRGANIISNNRVCFVDKLDTSTARLYIIDCIYTRILIIIYWIIILGFRSSLNSIGVSIYGFVNNSGKYAMSIWEGVRFDSSLLCNHFALNAKLWVTGQLTGRICFLLCFSFK